MPRAASRTSLGHAVEPGEDVADQDRQRVQRQAGRPPSPADSPKNGQQQREHRQRRDRVEQRGQSRAPGRPDSRTAGRAAPAETRSARPSTTDATVMATCWTVASVSSGCARAQVLAADPVVALQAALRTGRPLSSSMARIRGPNPTACDRSPAPTDNRRPALARHMHGNMASRATTRPRDPMTGSRHDPVRAGHQALPGRHRRGRGPVLRGRRGRAGHAGRPVRLRQDHHDEDGQPAGRAHQRPHLPGRRGHRRRRPGRAAPPHRLRHPAGRAVPAPDGPGEHRDRPASARLEARRRPGRGPPNCSTWSASTRPSTATATRTSSPAASASASGWPGRWPPTRPCC